MRANDLIIDTKATLKEDKFLLIEAKNAVTYDNGVKTDKTDGVRLTIVLRNVKFEKINVKVPTINFDIEKEIPAGTEVKFTNLTIIPYISNNNLGLSCKADSAEIIGVSK